MKKNNTACFGRSFIYEGKNNIFMDNYFKSICVYAKKYEILTLLSIIVNQGKT